MDGGAWQASTTFNGLTPNTVYQFEARKTETATHFAGCEWGIYCQTDQQE
jgi:hypothetical protein